MQGDQKCTRLRTTEHFLFFRHCVIKNKKITKNTDLIRKLLVMYSTGINPCGTRLSYLEQYGLAAFRLVTCTGPI